MDADSVNIITSLSSQNIRSTFFDPVTLPLYLLGFCTFLITIIDDWLNPKKTFKPFLWYVQDFLYTLIAIALGISICYAMELSQSVTWIVTIFMGLCGSSLIRKIRSRKDEICDSAVNKVINKIENPKD